MSGIADFSNRPGPSRARRGLRPAYEAMEVRLVPSGVNAAFAVTQDWGSGFQASITLTNTQATPVNNWSLAFDYAASIDQIWNATIVSHVGNHYVITGAAWDNILPAKGGVSFGFNGSPGHTTAAPANYTLNGVPLSSGGGNVPSVSINNVTVAEPTSGSTPVSFTVSLSAAATSPITVNYSTADGSARAGADYTATSGTLTLAAGQTSKSVTVQVVTDKSLTTNETFQFDLANPVGATLAQAVGTATITAPPLPPPPPPPTSGSGSASFAVTQDWGGGFQGQVTVKNTSGTAWNAWTVEFDFPYAINSVWDASLYSHVGNHYVIQNASYDGSVAPGGTASFGFTATPGNVKAGPTNFVVHYGGPVDHRPDAVNVSAWTSPGQAVTIAVLANDSDPDGDPISLVSAAQGQHGTVAVNMDGTLTYTPTSGFQGSDTFAYTIGDGRGLTASASVTVQVSQLTWPAHVFAPHGPTSSRPTST
ncbi:MAG TPA: cellulose binding domain-containing protein [Isosphaeraceae bacterium]